MKKITILSVVAALFGLSAFALAADPSTNVSPAALKVFVTVPSLATFNFDATPQTLTIENLKPGDRDKMDGKLSGFSTTAPFTLQCNSKTGVQIDMLETVSANIVESNKETMQWNDVWQGGDIDNYIISPGMGFITDDTRIPTNGGYEIGKTAKLDWGSKTSPARLVWEGDKPVGLQMTYTLPPIPGKKLNGEIFYNMYWRTEQLINGTVKSFQWDKLKDNTYEGTLSVTVTAL